MAKLLLVARLRQPTIRALVEKFQATDGEAEELWNEHLKPQILKLTEQELEEAMDAPGTFLDK